jgi:hypothetical protein
MEAPGSAGATSRHDASHVVQTDADRNSLIWYFGQKRPKWLAWDELNQHTLWTAGQIVANFRKHGMAPPPFSYY